MSGCRSKNSTSRRPNLVVILTLPPHKPKELLQPVDTSSQVITEMAEASLLGNATSISPIAMTSRSGCITPPADAMELWENANKALEELLTTKASIDTHRWRDIWELGMEFLSEWVLSDWVHQRSQSCLLPGNSRCSGFVLCHCQRGQGCLHSSRQRNKMTQACTIQEAKASCSTAIRDAKAWMASQAKLLQRKYGNIMWDLEMQAIWVESRSQADFLSTCQATLYASPAELKSTLVASYLILLEQTPPSHPFILSQRASPVEEQPTSAAPPTPVPKQSPRPKRWHPSPDPVESMPLGRTTLKMTSEGPPAPSSKRPHLGTKHSSWATWRHLAGTLTW